MERMLSYTEASLMSFGEIEMFNEAMDIYIERVNDEINKNK